MRSILVVEDNRDVREWWVSKLLLIFDEAEIAAVASLKAAREHCQQTNFSLVLIDLGLPDGSGIDLLSELSASAPDTYCVITTMYDDDKHIFDALHAGASGYLIKDQAGERQLELLREIANGQPPLSPRVARRILSHFSQNAQNAQHTAARLTTREKEVLLYIAQGYSRPQVAAKLNLSVSTVCGHTRSIYQKLDISSQAEAALAASRIGLLHDSSTK